MLRILLGKRPEPFSSPSGEDSCLQSCHGPLRTCLKSLSVSLITLVASDLSFDSPVTRITGSVPLSRTRTQAVSVLTLNPNFVSTDEFFPRIFFKPVASVENFPPESFPEYLIPSLIIWYSGTSLTISDARRPRSSVALRNSSPDRSPSGQLL